jgi:rhomboid protease GluP
MDTNRILHLLASLYASILLFRSVRGRTWGFAAVSVLVVLTAAAGAVFFLDSAGYIAFALWAVVVLLPVLGQRWLGRLTGQQRYAAAARFSRGLRFLHPADGWWEQHRLFQALDLGQQGRIGEAAAVLEGLASSSKEFAQQARVHLLRMRGCWEAVVAWLDERQRGPEAWKDPSLLLIYLRALGETGALERLVKSYAASEARLEGAGLRSGRDLCRLFVFAFSGRAEQVAALFKGPLSAYPEAQQTFWRATAELARDPEGPARAVLAALLDLPDASLRISVRRRLDHPLADPRVTLSLEAQGLLERLERARDQEARYGPLTGGFRPYATFGLMVPILAMFLAEVVQGGSEDVETIYELGAVWPEAVLAGEWWRVGAATLLHHGPLHLGMNLLGLHVLGPYVEYALGRVRYVAVYVLSSVGMMVAVVLLYWAGLLEPMLLAGASGGVMGLVGATGAVMWRARRLEGSQVARQRLRGVLLILGAQSIFDLLTPQVSFLSHMGGALLGFLITSAMTHLVTPPRRATSV